MMKSRPSKSGSGGKKSPPVREAPIGSSAFPVVAIGASAGGLEAYKEFFQALPSGTGMAFAPNLTVPRRHPFS
jgi:two-component system, chemotaxis family, CheB/CheR fusion protein